MDDVQALEQRGHRRLVGHLDLTGHVTVAGEPGRHRLGRGKVPVGHDHGVPVARQAYGAGRTDPRAATDHDGPARAHAAPAHVAGHVAGHVAMKRISSRP